GQGRRGVIGTAASPLFDFFLGLERLAAIAVVTGIDAFVDVAGVEHRLDELAASHMVSLFAGLDELVVRDVERAPDISKLPGHFVYILLGVDAQLAGALRYFDCVFVVPHQKMDGNAFHAAESRLNISADLLERGADVWAAVGIIDRRGDKKPRSV